MAQLVYQGTHGLVRAQLKPRTTLGRSPDCDVVVEHGTVSRRHATILLVDGRYVLQDEGARFGCRVNGAPAQRQVLSHGDEILLGEAPLRFEESTSEAPRPSSPSGATLSPAALAARVRELEGRVGELEAAKRHTDVQLALHETFARCDSISMLVQTVGPDVVRELRFDQCLLSVREQGAPSASLFRHRLESLPAAMHGAVQSALASGTLVEANGAAGSRSLVLPLRARGVEGYLFGELGPGRALTKESRDLLEAMVVQVATACSRLALQQRVRREERTRAELSRYMSDQVVQAVMEGRLHLESAGQRRQVTVLFADVRGFTSLSERLRPEDVLQILNEHFGVAVPVIKGALGSVDKFMGDAVMSVFGAPNDLPDHPLRAVRAAQGLLRGVAELRRRWAGRPWAAEVEKFAIGVGLNTGMAVAGHLGSEDRREYAVIGDAVNVASRLCSNAAPGQILIGPETAAAVAGKLRLSEPIPLQVKGRAQAVEAFRVLDDG